MNYKQVFYKDLRRDDWDTYIKKMPDAGLYHSWSWVNYITKFPNLKANLSFICLAEDRSPLAVCPLAVSFNSQSNYFEMSFGGNPCAVPLIADVKPSMRRKVLDEIFNTIIALAKEFDVKKLHMIWDPLVNHFCAETSFHKNHFELLRYQLNYYAENVLVIDLELAEGVLFEKVSKYQRRHIQRAEKKGIEVKVFNSGNNSTEINKYFTFFQEAHFKSAGKLTRPQETWDAMLECILIGDASLFVAFSGELPISYLFCGEFNLAAFGWSQVNIEEFESEYAPRHIVEWKAILHYKTRQFKFYEVGERYYGSQFYHIPTPKEISISILKERFGGFMLPKIKWTGYFDGELLTEGLFKESKEFISSASVVKIPEY